MPDDALAKAAFVAYHMQVHGYGRAAAEDEWENTSWPEGRIERWSAIARAVLEAAGHDGLQQLAEAVASIGPDSESASAIMRSFAREKEKKQGYVSGEVTWLNRVAVALEKVERSGLLGLDLMAALQRAGKE